MAAGSSTPGGDDPSPVGGIGSSVLPTSLSSEVVLLSSEVVLPVVRGSAAVVRGSAAVVRGSARCRQR